MLSAASVLLRMSQVDVGVSETGILNREWAVVPPSRRLAATPVVATAMASPPSALTVARRVFSRKVFPHPADQAIRLYCGIVLSAKDR